MRSVSALAIVLIASLLVAGCIGGTPEPTPTPATARTPTPVPTAPTGSPMTTEICAAKNVTAAPRTAFESIVIFDDMAKAWSDDARLISLTSVNVSLDGRSIVWAAAYASTNAGAYATLRQEAEQISCDERAGGELPAPETRPTLQVTIDSVTAIERVREEEVIDGIAAEPGALATLGATVHDETVPEEPGSGWRVSIRGGGKSATRWVQMDGR